MNFKDLSLKPEIIRAIEAVGYKEPSEIQEKTIPLLLEDKDVLGQSQTGTGKTAAFMLPLLDMIMDNDNHDRKPKALILLPTRELALQVASEGRKFSQFIDGIRIVSIYGGESIEKQIKDLKRGADIIVGTPGRVMDHIRRRTLKLEDCNKIVLDEADEMLNMGFYDDIIEVLSFLPEQRQTILFSATMPRQILELTKKIQHDPELVKIKASSLTVSTITQVYYEINPNAKIQLLLQILQLRNPKSAMIFSNTKKMVDELATELNNANYPAAALHGDMKQEMRTAVMERFKEKKIAVLIATDVAARGIDVENVDMVINFDIPQELEYYVHRIGRTGRAGKSGVAITLATPRQHFAISQIEKLAKCTIEKLPLPTKEDLQACITDQLLVSLNKWKDRTNQGTKELLEKIEESGLSDTDILYALINQYMASNALNPLDAPSRAVRSEGSSRGSRNSNSVAMTKLVLSVGEKQGITAAHIVSSIAESCNISGKEIGKIKIEQRSSIVEVPQSKEREILKSLENATIKGKPVFVTAIHSKENKGYDSSRGRNETRRRRN